MRDKEISVLLGCNGAGKSTAMNMMTGMLEADAGDCYIYGKSVRQELSKVRQMIGFCPQHNILWPELTCREHLEYFGKIKGLRGHELEESILLMLKEVDLLDKIDAPSHSLSGGQKRKLSIAIAFVGRSPLVFLDEPTAGLDVGARRYIWELLKRMCESHTIFLTTHYMDEADLLGHRIGIMSQGRLSCNGTSFFLKSTLGKGYSLCISLAPNVNEENVENVILKTIPDAEEIGIHGEEMLYRLPKSAVPAFPTLLNNFDEDKEVLGIRGYSLAATTLEDVFMQVATDEQEQMNSEELQNKENSELNTENDSDEQIELI